MKACEGEGKGVFVSPAKRVELLRILVEDGVVVTGLHLDLQASAFRQGDVVEVGIRGQLPQSSTAIRSVHSGGLVQAPLQVVHVPEFVVGHVLWLFELVPHCLPQFAVDLRVLREVVEQHVEVVRS